MSRLQITAMRIFLSSGSSEVGRFYSFWLPKGDDISLCATKSICLIFAVLMFQFGELHIFSESAAHGVSFRPVNKKMFLFPQELCTLRTSRANKSRHIRTTQALEEDIYIK
jgi:hypothetical protein